MKNAVGILFIFIFLITFYFLNDENKHSSLSIKEEGAEKNFKKLVVPEIEDKKSVSLSTKSQGPQNEENLIKETLMNYIEGTANGNPERIRKAFAPSSNLLSVADDDLKILSIQEYIRYFENRKKRNRVAHIVSIDVENNAAMAKLKIEMPDKKRTYIDFVLLLKYKGQWKIVDKSYTHIENHS